MTALDLAPLYRSAFGFTPMISLLDSVTGGDQAATAWPPYDIEQVDEDKYRITLAVAGFSDEELSVETKDNTLTITGTGAREVTTGQYLHRGIPARDFRRRFRLENHVKVKAAKLENGLLRIDLERELPESMKPKKIAINSGENRGELLESKSGQS